MEKELDKGIAIANFYGEGEHVYKSELGWQCDCDTHDDGQVLFSFVDAADIWDNVLIDGKRLDEVLERSFITALN